MHKAFLLFYPDTKTKILCSFQTPTSAKQQKIGVCSKLKFCIMIISFFFNLRTAHSYSRQKQIGGREDALVCVFSV